MKRPRKGAACAQGLKNGVDVREVRLQAPKTISGVVIIVEVQYCLVHLGFQSPLSSGEEILIFYSLTLYISKLVLTDEGDQAERAVQGWAPCKIGRLDRIHTLKLIIFVT